MERDWNSKTQSAATFFGRTTNRVRGSENSVFRFQNPQRFSLPAQVIRLIRVSESSHF